jgi:hypothetical protein
MRMSSGQWITGCLVILAATVGGALSAPWAERTFVRPTSAAADPANAPHKRTCITISGKRFEWDHPNTPFGTLSCSD